MNYPGGKGVEGVYHSIINQMPPHHSYIEPFLGGGAILRYKKPAVQSWACEIDPDVFGRFATEFEHPDFHRSAALVDLLAVYDSDGKEHTWYDAEGLPNLYLQQADAITFLTGFCFQDLERAMTLVYCDPPYLMEVRSTKKPIYKHDFSTWFDHEELLRLLLRLKCYVMISGYDHPLYNDKLAGWRKISFTGITRGGPRTECLWMNYPEPAELHDYRYLGSTFREREKLKRRKNNLLAKLERLPVLERYALLAAVEEFRNAGGGARVCRGHR